jgi:hypothetical protein
VGLKFDYVYARQRETHSKVKGDTFFQHVSYMRKRETRVMGARLPFGSYERRATI